MAFFVHYQHVWGRVTVDALTTEGKTGKFIKLTDDAIATQNWYLLKYHFTAPKIMHKSILSE